MSKGVLEWGANEVLPGIFLGGERDAMDHEGMRQAGVTHILNVADNVPNHHPLLFTYLRLEVSDDGRDKGISRVFDQGLQFVGEATTQRQGQGQGQGRVLVHCLGGINRSATMAIFCVMNIKGWDLRRAYAHVHSCRHQIDPMLDNQKELIRFAIKVHGEHTDLPPGWSLRARRKRFSPSQH